MGGGNKPDNTYVKCKICGKLVKRGMGLFAHRRKHKNQENKEQQKLI
jgi:hypothetical protein